jgi:hypothetical protein
MYCKTCNGRVLVDRVFSENTHLELFCIMCGKRWMLEKGKSGVAAWLLKLEAQRASAVTATA